MLHGGEATDALRVEPQRRRMARGTDLQFHDQPSSMQRTMVGEITDALRAKAARDQRDEQTGHLLLVYHPEDRATVGWSDLRLQTKRLPRDEDSLIISNPARSTHGNSSVVASMKACLPATLSRLLHQVSTCPQVTALQAHWQLLLHRCTRHLPRRSPMTPYVHRPFGESPIPQGLHVSQILRRWWRRHRSCARPLIQTSMKVVCSRHLPQYHRHRSSTLSRMCSVTHVAKITLSTSYTIIADHVTMASTISVYAVSVWGKDVDTGLDSVGRHGYVTNDKLLPVDILPAVNARMC